MSDLLAHCRNLARRRRSHAKNTRAAALLHCARKFCVRAVDLAKQRRLFSKRERCFFCFRHLVCARAAAVCIQ